MNSTIPSPRETNTHHAFGQPRETIESARHVRGGGKFVADLQLPGMLHVALLRSPKAHARIVEIDVRQARSLLGVHAILTGADVQKSTSSIYTMAQMHKPPLDIPLHALATDKVRHVGEPVVAVAARTRAIAEDAVRLIRVKYEDLPPVADADAALASGAPLVHENIAGNLIMHRQHDFGDAESVFKNADHVDGPGKRALRWRRSAVLHNGSQALTSSHFGVITRVTSCYGRWDRPLDCPRIASRALPATLEALLAPSSGNLEQW